MFLKNHWYVAALSQELAERPLGRIFLGEPVVLYRTADGAAVALEDRCVHRQAPLSLGEVVGDALQCGYHGLTFDRTGACIHVPGQTAIPPGACVRSYPVIERQGFVFIWMGDAARAAEQAPYDFPFGERPGWRALYARFHAKCDYRLLIDNLMDLTHLAFAHRTTIGAPGVAEGAEMKVQRGGDAVTITRWMMDIAPAPAHVRATGHEGNVDRWQVIQFDPPGFVWLKVGSAVAGSGAREGRTDGVLLDRHSLHAITPETAATTHYFWTTAHDTAQVGPEQEQVLYDQSVRAFHEDLAIIEGQQMRRDPTVPTVDINADAGQIQTRRLMERLLAEEAAETGAVRAAE